VSERTAAGSSRTQRWLGYLALALLSYVPVLRALPGKVSADTKTYLYLDPGRVLSRAWSMWDPNIGLGTVTHQNIGYLFPMGPFFWLTHAVGIPMWVAQRIWLGSIIFFAGLGILYLMRTLGVRGAGVPVAALAFMLSPYLLDYSSRTSVILLPWAGLPWLLAFTVRALREGGWKYPALIALTIQVVGSVNATALVFAVIPPALWVPYAIWVVREVDWRRGLASTLRIGGLALGASLWWIAGLWAQGSYGLDILKYTETLASVSVTSMPSEVLRGLGHWLFYGKDKLGPWIVASTSYTQNPGAIALSFLVPVLALLSAGLVRWRHRAFFIVTAFVGVVIAVGSHPYDSPTPLGGVLKDLSLHNTAAFALRSSGRAVPIVALGLAVLLGVGVNATTVWLDGHRSRIPLRLPAISVAVLVALLVILNLNALWTGEFYGSNLDHNESVPQYWVDAAHALDNGEQTRALEVPGIDFASYRWGNTIDPITPGLMDRPYVARELIPYGSPASANLLNAFDLRLQSRQLPPDGIAPVSRLMSVGDIVTRNDIQFERYGVIRPTFVWQLFTPTPSGLQEPQSFGPTVSQSAGGYPFHDEQYLEAGADLADPPAVAIFGVDSTTPVVRASSASDPILMAGDGDGVVDASAAGMLAGNPMLLYSGTFANDPGALRQQVGRGSVLVVTDTNRERARRWGSVVDTEGYTEGPGDHPLVDDPSNAQLDMFPGAGENAYTTTRLVGAKSVGATSYGNPVTYTPEYRATNAFDGNPDTAWETGALSDPLGERIRIQTRSPITTNQVDLLQPFGNRYITRARLTFDGGHAVDVNLSAPTTDGQRVLFPRRTFSTFQVQILDTNHEHLANYSNMSPVGFREIRLVDQAHGNRPVRVSEIIKMPTDLLDAAGTASASQPLIVMMNRERTTTPTRSDSEPTIVRQFSLPTTRSFAVGAQVRLSADATDTEIDRALGYDGPLVATSTARLAGDPGARASAALDGNAATAWTTPFGGVVGQSVTVRVPAVTTFGRLDLQVVADDNHSIPKELVVRSDTGEQRTVTLPVVGRSATPNAVASVPVRFAPISGSQFTVTIAAIDGITTRQYACDCDVTMPAAIAELGIPGLPSMAPPATLPDVCRNDLITVDGQPVPARVVGSTAALAGLQPAGVEACSGTGKVDRTLARGTHVLRTQTGQETSLTVDRLTMGSAAGGPPLTTVDDQGNVTSPASAPGSDVAAVHVTSTQRAKIQATIAPTTAPFWLVLGQSSNSGWRATVDGHDLGAPVTADGYGNGWLVHAPTSGKTMHVTLEWVPQRTVNRAIALSIAFAALCLGIVLVGFGVRRRRARWRALADAVPVLVSPLRVEGPPARTLRTCIAVVLALVVGAVTVNPLVGVLLAGAVLATMRWSRARPVLSLLPAATLAACAVYVVYQQWQHRYPSQFNWPTFFGTIRTLGWASILFLVGDALVELFRRRPGDDRGT
jgi:arabinofuranan 3-O-arabinosyltransferase